MASLETPSWDFNAAGESVRVTDAELETTSSDYDLSGNVKVAPSVVSPARSSDG